MWGSKTSKTPKMSGVDYQYVTKLLRSTDMLRSRHSRVKARNCSKPTCTGCIGWCWHVMSQRVVSTYITSPGTDATSAPTCAGCICWSLTMASTPQPQIWRSRDLVRAQTYLQLGDFVLGNQQWIHHSWIRVSHSFTASNVSKNIPRGWVKREMQGPESVGDHMSTHGHDLHATSEGMAPWLVLMMVVYLLTVTLAQDEDFDQNIRMSLVQILVRPSLEISYRLMVFRRVGDRSSAWLILWPRLTTHKRKSIVTNPSLSTTSVAFWRLLILLPLPRSRISSRSLKRTKHPKQSS